MKKNFTHLLVSSILLIIFGIAASPPASGQSAIGVQPTPLYRFQVSYNDGGHLLTGIYAEGPANGYTFDQINYPYSNGLGIYVPPPGYTPDPSSGLIPLHRWTVVQSGWRTHYYYSIYYTQQPPDRFYNGIAGWVFSPGQFSYSSPAFINPLPLHKLSVFYSTDLGFWNGYGGYGYSSYTELPPDRQGKSAYGYQGIICSLPEAGVNVASFYTITFYPPSPPPDPPPGGGTSCNPSSGMVNRCQHNGGWWDYESCSCQY